MHTMSTRSASIEYYKQQYCTLFNNSVLTADLPVSQGHSGVKLVQFHIAHISLMYHGLSCIELKLGTTDDEGITQQTKTLCSSVLGIF